MDVSDDPAAFTDQNLKRYKALIFDNTNNEIFDNEEQKAAFQRYIRAGGGFVGIHSASGSMRQWPWFWSVVGGKFSRHAKTAEVHHQGEGPQGRLDRPPARHVRVDGRVLLPRSHARRACTCCWRAT